MRSLGPIIIIDDDLDDHFMIKEVARSLRLSNPLIFLRNGAEALEFFMDMKENPLVIFCDLNMPIMNGLTLRKEIHNNRALREKSIPFIFYSTGATDDQVRKAYELTVQGFFLKEANFEKMKRTFQLILDYWDLCKHPNDI